MTGQLPLPPRRKHALASRTLLACALAVSAGAVAFHSTAFSNAISAAMTVFLTIGHSLDEEM